MDFSDFLTMDVIINRDKSLVASFLGPKTKRQRRKAYERWLNTHPGFDGDDVARQNLTEAAARMVYGSQAVDHYLAVITHHYPWREPFVAYWQDEPDLRYIGHTSIRFYMPGYQATGGNPADLINL